MADTLERRHIRIPIHGLERRRTPFRYPCEEPVARWFEQEDEEPGASLGQGDRKGPPSRKPWDPWDDPERFE
jgi:hypothetical protein